MRHGMRLERCHGRLHSCLELNKFGRFKQLLGLIEALLQRPEDWVQCIRIQWLVCTGIFLLAERDALALCLVVAILCGGCLGVHFHLVFSVFRFGRDLVKSGDVLCMVLAPEID